MNSLHCFNGSVIQYYSKKNPFILKKTPKDFNTTTLTLQFLSWPFLKFRIAYIWRERELKRNITAHIPSVPLGVMELLLMCELSRLGPLGDSLLPLIRLWGLARSCISIDLTKHTHMHTPNQITHITLVSEKTHSSDMQCCVHSTHNTIVQIQVNKMVRILQSKKKLLYVSITNSLLKSYLKFTIECIFTILHYIFKCTYHSDIFCVWKKKHTRQNVTQTRISTKKNSVGFQAVKWTVNILTR